MEHEVFVPVLAETLRQTLRDPARVARCVPGLQQDADESAGAPAGRLKVRIGGHTITYRGALTLTERDGVFTAEGEGTEARGTGSVKLTLTLRLTETGAGTTLAFTGSAHVEGRLAELPAGTATAAAHRLLDRVVARLGEESVLPGAPEAGADDDGEARSAGKPAGESPAESAGESQAESPAESAGEPQAESAGRPSDEPSDASVFDVEVPPSSLDGETTSAEGDFLIPDEPLAEAAHARRTMIGRSAEEVDHAPPRGRYAPVPAPEAAGAGATLRWVAPAAALALASAVVVGRALRRRR
ncbi:SRPBCC domain-containing protein [Streptomyces sp. NPDC051569]|uniref:SRPBCC domain-containing protein n=1 Tax=Streptomyces sp. NPDC051569 TaxID=3365661 RepID=UPI0037B3E170